MSPRNLLCSLAIVCLMTLTAAAADTTVTMSDVHLCCDNCVKGVTTALDSMKDVKAVSDKAASTVVITAPDKETAQKAVNALVLAGYFGKSSDSSIKVENITGATDAKVKTLAVSGVHLCCGKCVTAVKGVLAKVDGVTGNTVVQKAPTFMVTGDFNSKTLFDDLNKAGLAGRVGEAAPMPAH